LLLLNLRHPHLGRTYDKVEFHGLSDGDVIRSRMSATACTVQRTDGDLNRSSRGRSQAAGRRGARRKSQHAPRRPLSALASVMTRWEQKRKPYGYLSFTTQSKSSRVSPCVPSHRKAVTVSVTQAIARAIAKNVGLADEFELAGAANLEPGCASRKPRNVRADG